MAAGAEAYPPARRNIFSRLAAGMSKEAPGSFWKRLAFLVVLLALIWGSYMAYQKWGHGLAVRLGLAQPKIIMTGEISSPLRNTPDQSRQGPPDWGPLLRPGKPTARGAAGSVGSGNG